MAKPLLFITGFLGAGKTTLLRALLDELGELDRTADVILNDFENAHIDASTVDDRAASIHPIAASCACCESLDDLVQLCLTAQRSEGDVLLIELNGTADPLPLLETFTLLEKKMPFLPRWQVGVVDARHWGRRDEFAPLERRQFETATHWLPTHTEQLSKSEMGDLVTAAGTINPHAVRAGASEIAIELVGSTGSRVGGGGVRSESEPSARVASVKDREHRLSHRFTGCQIPMPGRYRHAQMIRLLEELPSEVVRAKALVELDEAPGSRWLFQRTGCHPVEDPQQVDIVMRAPASLVCIGPRLAREKLTALVASHSRT